MAKIESRSLPALHPLGVALCLLAAILLASAGLARGADAAVYPGGGSAFADGAEGWSPEGAACTPVGLLCTSEGVHDEGAGNPPGSISARTTLTVNLVSLFKGTLTWRSPNFQVPVGAITGSSIRLDRAFSEGALVSLGPEATYSVRLRDLAAGTERVILSEQLTDDGAFARRSAPVDVTGGHTYRLYIDVTTSQSVLAVSLLSGTLDVRFDNVGLHVNTSGQGGPGGGPGGGGAGAGGGSGTDARLLAAIYRQGIAGPAILRGNRLLVRVRCPRRVGSACRITARGMLNRRRAATRRATVRVKRGKAKRVALRVKPRFLRRIAKRKRILVRETVRAGGVKATVQKRRRLIRR